MNKEDEDLHLNIFVVRINSIFYLNRDKEVSVIDRNEKAHIHECGIMDVNNNKVKKMKRSSSAQNF
jgi:hypothetical protein